MRLSIKILIIMAILVMGYAMLGYSTLQAVIVPGFDRLERKEALENLQRVERALSGELDYLVYTNTDWSEWTDTYRFVLGEYEEYVEANLSYDTLVNIGLNVMAFYDLGGRVLWIGAYDLENGADLDVREFLPDGTASRTPYLAHTDKDGEVRIDERTRWKACAVHHAAFGHEWFKFSEVEIHHRERWRASWGSEHEMVIRFVCFVEYARFLEYKQIHRAATFFPA